MCKAMEDMRNASFQEGIQVGRQEGKQEGLREGLQEGRQEGIMEGWDQALLLSGKIIEELKRHPFYTSEQIAEGLGCRPEIVEDIRKKMDL